MDLVALGMKLKNDPQTYRGEYIRELRACEALINLSAPPTKQIKPLLSFFVKNCHVDPERSVALLLSALAAVKDIKVRKAILGGLVLVRQKGLIESRELLRNVLLYGPDLTVYLRGCQEFLDMDCYPLLAEWYQKGTEKQKSFCYYFLVQLFTKIENEDDSDSESSGSSDMDSNSDNGIEAGEYIKRVKKSSTDGSRETANSSCTAVTRDRIKEELEDLICNAFFGSGKITKICMLYFLNRTEIAFDISQLAKGAVWAKRMYKELTSTHLDRDIKIMKLRIFVLFKRYFKLRCSITGIVLKMIDLEKEDLGELLDCLVSSVERSEARTVLKVLSEEFVNENKDDDVICYGFNVMREIYCRLAGIEKPSGLALNIDEDEAVNNIASSSEEEQSSSEEGCEPEERGEPEDQFVSELKELILEYVYPFKGNRTKSIHYAYKALIKAVIKNEGTDRPTNFILKSKTKEEREKLRKKNTEERRREIAKERREKKQKKNRKGRMKNKKNRLLAPSRKKTKRS